MGVWVCGCVRNRTKNLMERAGWWDVDVGSASGGTERASPYGAHGKDVFGRSSSFDEKGDQHVHENPMDPHPQGVWPPNSGCIPLPEVLVMAENSRTKVKRARKGALQRPGRPGQAAPCP